jgi:SAM-dependent methyltransferase
VEPEPGSLAEYFNGWYADMTGSPVKDEIQQRHLGLPAHLLSTSLLGWDGIAEAAAGLRLFPGGTLVDLACGRGGYGLEIAARTGARLIGVDFSAEAVRQAREHARRLGVTADFRIGDLAATGLDAGSADAVLCVDAIQFAPQPDAAYGEIRRILTSGGRTVLTNWEPLERDDQRLPDRLRGVDLGAGLTAAGFEAVEVTALKRSTLAGPALTIPAGCAGRAPRQQASGTAVTSELNGTYRWTMTARDGTTTTPDVNSEMKYPSTFTATLRDGRWTMRHSGAEVMTDNPGDTYSVQGNGIKFHWGDGFLTFTYSVDAKGNLHLKVVPPVHPDDAFVFTTHPWTKIG